MTFAHLNSGAQVNNGDPITPQQLSGVFDALAAALDGAAGGAYAPSQQLSIGGSGIMDCSYEQITAESDSIDVDTLKHRVFVVGGEQASSIRVSFTPGAEGETRILDIDEVKAGTEVRARITTGAFVQGGSITFPYDAKLVRIVIQRGTSATPDGGSSWHVVSVTSGDPEASSIDRVQSQESFEAGLVDGRYPIKSPTTVLFGEYVGRYLWFSIPDSSGLNTTYRELTIYVESLNGNGSVAEIMLRQGSDVVARYKAGRFQRDLCVTFTRKASLEWVVTRVLSGSGRDSSTKTIALRNAGTSAAEFTGEGFVNRINARESSVWMVQGETAVRRIVTDGNEIGHPAGPLYRIGFDAPEVDGSELTVHFESMRHFIDSPVRFEQTDDDGSSWNLIPGSDRSTNTQNYGPSGPHTYSFLAIDGRWRFKGISY